MLLGMSKKAQPFINRLILQSGSALTHWAMHYNRLEDEKKIKNLALNFINFITCEFTLKYKCIVSKIKNYLQLYKTAKDSNLSNDSQQVSIDQILVNLLQRTSPSQFVLFLNKIFFTESFFFKKSKDWFINPKGNFKYAFNLFEFTQMKWHFDYEQCVSNYFLFNTNYFLSDKIRALFCKSLNDLASLQLNGNFLAKNQSQLRDFLTCFYEPYLTDNSSLNFSIIVSELKGCVDHAVELNKTSSNNFFVGNLANDISYFYDDIDFFYTPVIDNDIVFDNPYHMLNDENFSNIDIMVGVNKHESFYILEVGHDFQNMISNINEQANFIFNKSKTLNTAEMDTTKKKCLKNKLRKFYSGLVEGRSELVFSFIIKFSDFYSTFYLTM